MKTSIAPLLLLASTIANAQDIPPLAPLRGDAANLADTMKFIQEKLPRAVNYILFTHDSIAGTDAPPVRMGSILTQVSADAGRCSITFHSRLDVNNSVHERDGEILLKQVRGISLIQADMMQQRAKAQSGHPELSVKSDPPITLVVVTSAPNLDGVASKARVLGGGFSFYDDSLAERVSRALQHAVSLCGGGKPETF